MKRFLILILAVFLLPASLVWLSCGGSSSSSGSKTSGLSYRAFISNSVTSTTAAGVYIVNAVNDTRGPLAPISAGNTPGMMVVTPNLAQTLVFSANGTQFSDNQFTIIDNASESAASHVILPGMTESFVVSPDSSTAYVAVPTAPVTGQPSLGAIEVINLPTGAVTDEISCPPVNPTPPVCVWPGTVPQGFNQPYQFLTMGNTGTRILAFSDSQGVDSVADTIAVITPSSVGTQYPVITFVPGFDHPVAAFFNSDDTAAYVLNCGAECGGQQASIQTLDLTTLTAGPPGVACTPGGCIGTLNLPAGSVALINGSTMYVAGTPPFIGGSPQQPCTGETTAAQSCGLLTILDLSTMSVTNTAPIIITDGYHNRIALGPNGQLFIGARTCTEIVPPIPPPAGAEVRGCLSIYNTLTSTVGSVQPGGVAIPAENGDVTGIQPIVQRGNGMAQEVVYVVQGGSLYIYDATFDGLEYNPNNPFNPGEVSGLVGYFIDVKIVDF